MIDSTATFSGLIHCNDDVFDIKTVVSSVGTIPDVNKMVLVETINVNDPTTLEIPYIGEGLGSGEFTVDLDGPLSRVATSEPRLEVDNGNGTILLQINPNGLLQENMFVLGTIHLESFNGEQWVIDVELKATDRGDLDVLGNQALVLCIFFLVFAAWFAMSLVSKEKIVETQSGDQLESVEEFFPGSHR